MWSDTFIWLRNDVGVMETVIYNSGNEETVGEFFD